MSIDREKVISTLNDLIEICRDGAEGFRTCAENVEDPGLKQIFHRGSLRCSEAGGELQNEVLRLGGEPQKNGSVSGSLHRGWINIRAALTDMDYSAVLAECERGEDVAVSSYEAALREELPGDVRAIVERQYLGARENRERIRELRDALETR